MSYDSCTFGSCSTVAMLGTDDNSDDNDARAGVVDDRGGSNGAVGLAGGFVSRVAASVRIIVWNSSSYIYR